MLSPAFSPCPTMFSNASFSRGVISWDCVVKGLTDYKKFLFIK